MPITKGKGKKTACSSTECVSTTLTLAGSIDKSRGQHMGFLRHASWRLVCKAQYTSGAPHSGGITVLELYEEYMRAKKHEVRASIFANSEKFLRLYVIPIVGCSKINKLTNSVLQDWKNQLNSSHLSTTSKKHVYAEFRTLLNYAIKMTYLEKNLCFPLGILRILTFANRRIGCTFTRRSNLYGISTRHERLQNSPTRLPIGATLSFS